MHNEMGEPVLGADPQLWHSKGADKSTALCDVCAMEWQRRKGHLPAPSCDVCGAKKPEGISWDYYFKEHEDCKLCNRCYMRRDEDDDSDDSDGSGSSGFEGSDSDDDDDTVPPQWKGMMDVGEMVRLSHPAGHHVYPQLEINPLVLMPISS